MDTGVGGDINAMDLLLANVKGFEVTNGYLKILHSDEVGGMSWGCTCHKRDERLLNHDLNNSMCLMF